MENFRRYLKVWGMDVELKSWDSIDFGRVYDHEKVGKQIEESEKIMSEIFVVNDDYLTINAAYPYQIDWDRLKTHDNLLCWIKHLSGKDWFITAIMKRFIEVVYEHNGWEMDYNV